MQLPELPAFKLNMTFASNKHSGRKLSDYYSFMAKACESVLRLCVRGVI